MCTKYWLTACSSCSGKSVVRSTDRPAMTIAVDLGRKATKQANKPVRQTKQSNQLSLPHQDDCKTRMDIKLHTTNQRTIAESHNGSNNQQQMNNNNPTTLEQTAASATGCLNAFYWYQIFALDSAVVEEQNCLARIWGFPNYCNVSSWRNNLIKLTHYDETKKRAHDSQKVRVKENLKYIHRGPCYRQASDTNPQIKALRQRRHRV